ncbi:MAG TPA: response regulator [Chitinophagales bacterium]|nr:response regulator [Chitinophagales bacterium]
MKKLARELPLEILIAEDNFINQKLMLDILAMHGYTCDAAASGFETLEVVKKKKYDLILMDIQMPGMSGEETMLSVHELLGKNSPKIIAVTAYAMAGDRDKYISAGMDGYLSKPFRVNELMGEIVRVMKEEE